MNGACVYQAVAFYEFLSVPNYTICQLAKDILKRYLKMIMYLIPYGLIRGCFLEHKIASLISFVSISAFRKLTENIEARVRKLEGPLFQTSPEFC